MGVSKVLTSILMIGQLAVAGLIVGLVVTKLDSIKASFDAAHLHASVTDTCLMGSAPNGVNLCYVAYGFSGVSVAATLALGLLLCCTCNLCGLGALLDTVFALAGAAWWAIGGVVFSYYFKQPATAALPGADTRSWIVLLCWVGCALFAAAFLINLFRILHACCRCCSGDGRGSSRDVEAGRWSGKQSPPRGAAYGAPRYARQGQFIAQDVAPGAYWAAR